MLSLTCRRVSSVSRGLRARLESACKADALLRRCTCTGNSRRRPGCEKARLSRYGYLTIGSGARSPALRLAAEAAAVRVNLWLRRWPLLDAAYPPEAVW